MIYLDSAATTSVSRKSVEAFVKSCDDFGNPSSVHSLGFSARKTLESARETVSEAMGLKPSGKGRLVFTSGGSEGNNLALTGVALSKKRFSGGKIIITDSEHPSVMNTALSLEERGFEIIKISTKGGFIDKRELLDSIDEKVFMVSLMSVNNETGAVYDISDLFSEIKRLYPDVILHTDAVQAFKKINISPSVSNADLITVSGHKVHAPKGIGALYVSERVIRTKSLSPHIYGGGQEFSFRSGTESVQLAAAFAAAVSETENADRIRKTREKIILGLDKKIKINEPEKHADGILSLTLPGIKSETMVNYLSSKEICISAGSACSSHGGEKSYVLRAFGLTPEEADYTVRVSFGDEISDHEIEIFTESINLGIGQLAGIK